MKKPGDRVGAICGSGVDGGVNFFGYGIYQGYHPLPVGTQTPFGVIEDERDSFPNPKILLDSGDVIYGCQCWWGNEEAVRAHLDVQYDGIR